MTLAVARALYDSVTAQLADMACGIPTSSNAQEDPTMPTIIVSTAAGTPSAHYPEIERERNGATDYPVTLTIDGRTIAEGGVTLFADKANGGMSSCGSPLDVWVSDSLTKFASTLSDSDRKWLIRALDVAGPAQSEVEIEESGS